jgi:hypothetical protein
VPLEVVGSDRGCPQPQRPAGSLARWDGTQWQPAVARNARGVSGSVGFVYALATAADALYVGGLFDVGGTVPASRIGSLAEAGWTTMGVGVTGAANARVSALAVRGAEVFAAGNFTNAGGVPVRRIARWDGANWRALGEGLNSNVLALAVADGKLFAGGEFTGAGGAPARHLACWDGAVWSEVGGWPGRTVAFMSVAVSPMPAPCPPAAWRCGTARNGTRWARASRAAT